jgi:hypothetical protein
MTDKVPFTIEILGLDHDRPVVVDRVIGGSVYFEEAKRIGQRLLSIAGPGTHPQGYRVLTNDHELVYIGCAADNDEAYPNGACPNFNPAFRASGGRHEAGCWRFGACLACAFELTRRVAGNIVTVHTGFAYINALTKLPCIIIFVSLGDAHTLLIRVRNFLRTRCKADSCRHQNNEASQLHGAFSGC